MTMNDRFDTGNRTQPTTSTAAIYNAPMDHQPSTISNYVQQPPVSKAESSTGAKENREPNRHHQDNTKDVNHEQMQQRKESGERRLNEYRNDGVIPVNMRNGSANGSQPSTATNRFVESSAVVQPPSQQQRSIRDNGPTVANGRLPVGGIPERAKPPDEYPPQMPPTQLHDDSHSRDYHRQNVATERHEMGNDWGEFSDVNDRRRSSPPTQQRRRDIQNDSVASTSEQQQQHQQQQMTHSQRNSRETSEDRHHRHGHDSIGTGDVLTVSAKDNYATGDKSKTKHRLRSSIEKQLRADSLSSEASSEPQAPTTKSPRQKRHSPFSSHYNQPQRNNNQQHSNSAAPMHKHHSLTESNSIGSRVVVPGSKAATTSTLTAQGDHRSTHHHQHHSKHHHSYRHGTSSKKSQRSLSSSEEEAASTSECHSCDEKEVHSEPFSERG